MTTYITTYNKSEAETAKCKMNARLRRLGFQPSRIRCFQKSISDGKGDRFTITMQDGDPVDVTREFDPIF